MSFRMDFTAFPRRISLFDKGQALHILTEASGDRGELGQGLRLRSEFLRCAETGQNKVG